MSTKVYVSNCCGSSVLDNGLCGNCLEPTVIVEVDYECEEEYTNES